MGTKISYFGVYHSSKSQVKERDLPQGQQDAVLSQWTPDIYQDEKSPGS